MVSTATSIRIATRCCRALGSGATRGPLPTCVSDPDLSQLDTRSLPSLDTDPVATGGQLPLRNGGIGVSVPRERRRSRDRHVAGVSPRDGFETTEAREPTDQMA